MCLQLYLRAECVIVDSEHSTGDTEQVTFMFNAYKIVYVLYVNGSSFLRSSASDLQVAWNTSAERNLFLFVCGHACLFHGAESL